MKLRPIEAADIMPIARWMAQKENYQWLDFGNGTQILSPVSLKIMTQRDIHFVRAFTPDDREEAIGVVGLSNISRAFKTATLWGVLGDKTYARQGYATRAISEILTLGFTELGLEVVLAWVVEGNTQSLRLAERVGFKLIGRQRRCHYIDGRAYDRFLFDLLASEHKAVQHV